MMLEDTSSRAPHLYCQNPESLRFKLHSNLQCNSHALQSRPEGKNRSRKRQNGLSGNIQQTFGFGNRLHSIALCWDAQLGIGGFKQRNFFRVLFGICLNKSRLYCSNAGDPWGRRWWCIFNWCSIDFHDDSSNHHWGSLWCLKIWKLWPLYRICAGRHPAPEGFACRPCKSCKTRSWVYAVVYHGAHLHHGNLWKSWSWSSVTCI